MVRTKQQCDRVYVRKTIQAGSRATIPVGAVLDLADGLIDEPQIRRWLADGALEIVSRDRALPVGVSASVIRRENFQAWTRPEREPVREEPITRDQLMRRFKWSATQMDKAIGQYGFPAPSRRFFTSGGQHSSWRRDAVDAWAGGLIELAAALK